ncbi:RHS repeat-associated core domain-containing protein [Megamonas hypermegale]|uniref:RHS repeat-associated core domain-containing protein n=1 Tax=Megamonas hypermegale TaxID=158847 RepID=UPI0026EA8D32|nr:RHS repeat-associated core domain-containing protein [Megamonas hypermegale]
MNDGERIYKNDAFNRVTRVETTNGQVQINRYDAEGLRYEMEENKKLVQFIFNENREVVVEKSTDKFKRLIRSYDLWASECEPEKTWYHYASDEQGSIVFITDDNKVCNRYDYDAWGNLITCEEIIPNRFLYTGQQFDQITQQYYLRARFYNPVIARFTKEDVYRGDSLNLYAYCDNNPVIYYDPSGYKKEPNVVIISTEDDTLENFSKTITEELQKNKNRKKADVVRDFKYKDVEIHTSKYPHTNNTKGHWETILQKAYKEANTGDVGKILIDSPNNRLDPGKIDPSISRKEPDLIIVSKDGKNIAIYEVPSKTDYDKLTGDYKASYRKRLENNIKGLEKLYGNGNVKGKILPISSLKPNTISNNKNYRTVKTTKYKNILNRRG